ncbi:MAG: hypothetical protein PHP54_00700 [Clostridia bacterium]|nr:hypothetical protein [Clostridia bacterium]
MSKKTTIRLLMIIPIVAILLTLMILIDFNRVIQNIEPMFCIIKNVYEDGGTKEYIGIGYKIFDYKKIEKERVVKIGSIFSQYE